MRLFILKLKLCFLICFASNVVFSAAPDTLNVLQLTDIHFCNLTGYDSVFAASREHYGNVTPSLTTFFKTVPWTTKTNAVVITGDLIDYFSAETIRGNMLATQIEQFTELLPLCPVPLYLTLGNHDITCYWVDDENEKKSFQINSDRSRATWSRNVSCFANGTYYSKTLDVGNTSYVLLFLDNGYSLKNNAVIEQTQLDWVNYQLKMADGKPVVIFMHKYLPIPDYNGDDLRFTKRPRIIIDEDVCNEYNFIQTLNNNPNIMALIVGHGHKNVWEYLPFPAGHKILQVETAAFGKNADNWRLLSFTEKNLVISKTGTTLQEHVLNVPE